jgi:hypothetical protein
MVTCVNTKLTPAPSMDCARLVGAHISMASMASEMSLSLFIQSSRAIN